MSRPTILPSAGVVMMCASVLTAPLIDVFSKLAVASVPAGEVTASRFLFQSLFLLPFVLVRGRLFSRSPRESALNFLRGFLIVSGMTGYTYALKTMPVADAIAIFFVEPIILTILGSIFLKETIGWRRYTACGVGFFGSLLVIQPSLEEVGPIALLPVVAAFSLALFYLLTRLVAQKEDPWSMQFYAGLWGGLFSGLLLVIGGKAGISFLTPVMPDMKTTLYIAGAAVAAVIAGVLGVYAYRSAPASTLAPLQYLEIVSATILGWFVFGHLPDAVKWLGIAIIIGSGLYVIWRERKLNKTATTPPVSAPV